MNHFTHVHSIRKGGGGGGGGGAREIRMHLQRLTKYQQRKPSMLCGHLCWAQARGNAECIPVPSWAPRVVIDPKA